MELALAAGTALSGAATAIGGGATALTILQGAAGVASALAAIGKGNAEAASYGMQATQAKLEAGQEQNMGIQRTTALKRELVRVLGENDVAFASAGIDVGSGVAAEAARTAGDRTAEEITVDRLTTRSRMQMLKARAATYRGLADQARTTGWLGAAAAGLTTGFDILKRGVA